MEAKTFTKTIDQFNKLLQGLEIQRKIAIVDPRELQLLEKNARYMENEKFKNLVENVKFDKTLDSVPLCYKTEDGKLKVLSGNHRIKAAQEAQLENVLVLVIDEELSKEEQIAKQLSHNSIEGKDDKAILSELWQEIESIQMKYYAGFDDKELKELEKISLDSLSEAQLDFKSMTFSFLPNELGDVQDVFEKATKYALDNNIALARHEEFDMLVDAISKAQASYNVINSATALFIILNVFEKHYEELKEGWLNEEDGTAKHKNNVPMASIIGTDYIPSSTASLIKKALSKMIDKAEIKKNDLPKAFELMAKSYLDKNKKKG